jgi:hypothetical protein
LLTIFNFTEEAAKSPALVVFAVGPFFTLSASRLIVATVSNTDYSILEDIHLSLPILISMPLFILNSWFFGMNERMLILLIIAWGMFNSFWYTTIVVSQITEYLDIYCLSIKHPKKLK